MWLLTMCADWQLEKRIIDLRLIDVSHNAENVVDFGLIDKVFSIILDNAAAINLLNHILSGYVGSLFLHQ